MHFQSNPLQSYNQQLALASAQNGKRVNSCVVDIGKENDIDETEAKKRKIEKVEEVAFSLFQDLIEDLKNLIVFNYLDMPSRFSLSWTNQDNYQGFFDRRIYNPFDLADQCAESNYADLLAFSVSQGGPYDLTTACVAAKVGNYFESLQEVPRRSLSFMMVEIFEAACEGGHPELAKRVWTHAHPELPLNDLQLVESAAKRNSVKGVLKICKELKIEENQLDELLVKYVRWYDSPAICALAAERQPHLLEGSNLKRRLFIAGAESGVKKFMELAWDETADLDDAMQLILTGRNLRSESHYLECLLWVHDKLYPGQPLTHKLDDIPVWAKVEDLTQMKHKGCQFNLDTILDRYLCNSANHLKMDVVKWILDQGALVSNETIPYAACHSKVDLLELLKNKRVECVRPDATTLEKVIKYFHQDGVLHVRFRLKPLSETVNWLRREKYEWSQNLTLYGKFARNVHEHPSPLRMSIQEFIEATGMPITPHCRQTISTPLSSHRGEISSNVQTPSLEANDENPQVRFVWEEVIDMDHENSDQDSQEMDIEEIERMNIENLSFQLGSFNESRDYWNTEL